MTIIIFYYTTQAVRGPITKINQSKCSIASPIFSKYRTGHCPEWSRTYVFAVFAFFSPVINLLSTKLARDRSGRKSALCQDLGPIFSQYSPRAWLIRCIYHGGYMWPEWLLNKCYTIAVFSLLTRVFYSDQPRPVNAVHNYLPLVAISYSGFQTPNGKGLLSGHTILIQLF